jgi:hypothetical protein
LAGDIGKPEVLDQLLADCAALQPGAKAEAA